MDSFWPDETAERPQGRTITETLQHLRKCQSQGADNTELLFVLATDRIRRASNLCVEAIADLELAM